MDNLYTISRYTGAEQNTLTTIGTLPGVSNILTSIAYPFLCTATIRCTLTPFARQLECGWVIWGKFGDRNRSMRIDSIQYDDMVGSVVIRVVYADMWTMSHKIAANMERVNAMGKLSLAYQENKFRASFKEQIANLYGFLGNSVNKPQFASQLDSWDVAKEVMIFKPHLNYVLDEIGSVVDLYRPAWQPAEKGVIFSRPQSYILQSAVGMCKVLSSAKETAPTHGYGSGGGLIWTTTPARLYPAPDPTKPNQEPKPIEPTYGSYFERIYDAHDVYLQPNLNTLTAALLKQDADNAQYWEIEVINPCNQDIWIGDTVAVDFAPTPVAVTGIDFEQSGLSTRTYMRLGRTPVTVADRLRALRAQQTHQKEVESLEIEVGNTKFLEFIGLDLE